MGVARASLPNGSYLALDGRGDEPWSNALFWRGWDRFYEPETLPVFFELASRARVTFDIGASIGIFSLLAAHANRTGRVFAFEPDQRAFRRLVDHARLNGLTNVECHMNAVGDRHGVATLHAGAAARPEEAVAVSAQTSTTRAHVEAEVRRLARIEELRVPVVTVDGFVAERGLEAVDLVKIDAEGAEPEVLAGMSRTLARHHPTLVCEVLDAVAGKAIEEALAPHGYTWAQLTWTGAVPRDRIWPAGGGVWPNYLLTCSG